MQKRRSIAVRMALFLFGVLLASMILAGLHQFMNHRRDILTTAHLHGEAILGHLVKSVQLAGLDAVWLQSLVVSMGTELKIVRVVIVDRDSVIRAHSDPRLKGIFFGEMAEWRSTPAIKEMVIDEAVSGRTLLRLIAPVESISTKSRPIGTVLVDLNLTGDIHGFYEDMVIFGVVLLVLISSIIGAIYLFINQQILHPIKDLLASTTALAAGDLDKQVPVHRQDELGQLAQSFNRMTKDLRATMVSREYVDNILLSMTDMLIVLSPTGVIKKLNRPNLMGYTETDLIGRHIGKLFAGEGEEEKLFRAAKLRSLVQTGSITNADATLLAKDGQGVPVLISGSVLHNTQGEVTGIVIVARDITERRQMEDDLRCAKEKAETASQAKSAFLATMSHEIRTPLNAILGMNEQLLETEHNTERLRYLKIAKQAGVWLLVLINNVLDVSKIEAGQLKLETESFNVPDLVNQLAEILRQQVSEKGLFLTVQITPGVPSVVMGDSQRLRQVLLNLMSNAVKFTALGEVAVAVERGEGEEIHFSIADTGPGIPQEKQAAIFQPFVQADASTTRRFGGTGIGLHICKQLIELMDGRIWVESEVGKGSRFHCVVRLPQGMEPAQVIAPPALDRGKTVDPERPMRILLAEDVEVNALVIKAFLSRTRYRLDIAENGAKAYEKFQTGKYDLVLMDIEMPIMDGFTATRKIRAWETAQGTALTPIVALTAHVIKEVLDKTLEAGCDMHTTKPIGKSRLLAIIAQFCGHRSITAEQRFFETSPLPDHAAATAPPPLPNGHVSQGRDAASPINFKTLNQLRQEINADITPILERFCKSLPSRLADISYAIIQQDASELKTTAHKLKGTAATLGAETLASLCLELEQMGHAGTVPKDSNQLGSLTAEGKRVRDFMAAIL